MTDQEKRIKLAEVRALDSYAQEAVVGGRDPCFRLLFLDHAVSTCQREAYARAALKVIA